METIGSLIAMARTFMDDCADESRKYLHNARDIVATKELFHLIHEMMMSINLTSDSLLILVEKNRVWDATILLRSVIEGTAKFCYLLTAPSPDEEEARIEEFQEILPQKEMGALEQCVAAMKQSGFYHGSSVKGDVCIDPLAKVINETKTKEGEGSKNKEINKKWRFQELSKVLRNECHVWSGMADLWEYRYSMSNALVHKTDSGCGEISERADRNPEYRRISDLAHASSLLLANCMLFYTRFSILSNRIAGKDKTLASVIARNICLFEAAESVEQMFVEAYRKYEQQSSKQEELPCQE